MLSYQIVHLKKTSNARSTYRTRHTCFILIIKLALCTYCSSAQNADGIFKSSHLLYYYFLHLCAPRESSFYSSRPQGAFQAVTGMERWSPKPEGYSICVLRRPSSAVWPKRIASCAVVYLLALYSFFFFTLGLQSCNSLCSFKNVLMCMQWHLT